MNTSLDWRWAAGVAAFTVGLVLLRAAPAEAGALRVLGYGLLVGITVTMYLQLRHSDDEVVRAANVAAISFGAPVGLGLAFLSIFAVRFLPSANSYVTALATDASNAMGPGPAGFGMGVLFACLMVVLCALVAWAGWWLGKR